MIHLTVRQDVYIYDVYHITKAFFPEEIIVQKVDQDAEYLIEMVMEDPKKVFRMEESELEGKPDRKLKKRYVIQRVYDWYRNIRHQELAWGILTGVRPTKIFMSLMEEGMKEDEILQYMKETYRVSSEKGSLGLAVAKKEQSQLRQLDYENGYSLYVGIPFCPTRCSYCSFTSNPIALWKDRVEDYLDALCKELSFIASVSREKKLNTIYIGGGTPTTLEANQLNRLLTHLKLEFSYDDLKEFTVEAGRPDSITREKLMVLKQHNVGRISINPQTMHQKTLDLIGRNHTVEQICTVYEMARELGFDNINMDLIAGLPMETVEDFAYTLQEIQKMGPDSLTVHALAMKRASRLSQEQKEQTREEILEIYKTLSGMISLAQVYAKDMDLEPYYLYRQKNIAGNFENVGYAKVDKAGIYNILIMEEKQSIVAVGAGASTKIVVPHDRIVIDEKTGNPKKIVRTENVKDVEQYIDRIDEMIKRKGELLWH